jgi:hypothetical protein
MKACSRGTTLRKVKENPKRAKNVNTAIQEVLRGFFSSCVVTRLHHITNVTVICLTGAQVLVLLDLGQLIYCGQAQHFFFDWWRMTPE